MANVHHYRTSLAWSGSTGEGYDAYDRAHTVEVAGPDVTLQLTADPAFRGDPSLANPEQLLVAAASSCQLLSFLAVAARARLDVVAYRDEAEAVMPEDDPPMRITRINLYPHITLRASGGTRPDEKRLDYLVELAHRECFIANSLLSDVLVEPTIQWVD